MYDHLVFCRPIVIAFDMVQDPSWETIESNGRDRPIRTDQYGAHLCRGVLAPCRDEFRKIKESSIPFLIFCLFHNALQLGGRACVPYRVVGLPSGQATAASAGLGMWRLSKANGHPR